MPGPCSQPKGGKSQYMYHRKHGEPSVVHPRLKQRITAYETDRNLPKVGNMMHRPGSEQFHK